MRAWLYMVARNLYYNYYKKAKTLASLEAIHTEDVAPVSEYFINRFKGIAELVSVTNNFDRSNLKYTSDEDVKCLSQILTQVLKNAVFNVFVIGKPFDEVHREYHRKLEIIKTGAIAD